ncbi:MAG: ParB/RepB/Spo0J family partition protein, partial [Clostridia bacterium]|nr:ParB/RepB/Spo0J family partition protein [Clostridia bacterium]
MAKKNSLGRGLDSLFLENDEPDTGTVTMLRVSDIEPNPLQPRKTFDNEALGQLADSIARHGLLQPIAVRTNESGFYRIIAGERRWRAAKMAGMIEIPAIIYDMDDKKAAELALIENLQREDLNPIEEALAFRSLIE